MYDGEFKNGLPHGKGKSTNNSGAINEAFWVEGIDKMLLTE